MKVLITILCSISIACAQLPATSVSSFNLTYNDPSGTANAAHFIVPGYSFTNSPRFTIEQQAGNLILETQGESLVIENLPEQVLDLKRVIVRDLNLQTNQSRIYLGVNQLSGNNSETNIDVKNVSIDCDYKKMSDDIKDEVLNSCVNYKGQIKIERFTNNGKDVVNNADFKFNRNGLNFKIKASGYNINGSGKGYYTTGLLKIKVEKAKVGGINVVNRLFKELAKIKSPKIIISKPWISIEI